VYKRQTLQAVRRFAVLGSIQSYYIFFIGYLESHGPVKNFGVIMANIPWKIIKAVSPASIIFNPPHAHEMLSPTTGQTDTGSKSN